MIISREADYAIRLLRILGDGQRHGMADMCETEQIPKQFAYKIIGKLHKAGLVECIRGKNGGCELACDLHDVTVHDILRVVDNECYFNLCLTPGHVCNWQETHEDSCRVHHKLIGLQEELNNRLKEINLYHLIFE